MVLMHSFRRKASSREKRGGSWEGERGVGRKEANCSPRKHKQKTITFNSHHVCPPDLHNSKDTFFMVLFIYLSLVHIYCHIVDERGDGTFYLIGVP